jgi:hypothetical protein
MRLKAYPGTAPSFLAVSEKVVTRNFVKFFGSVPSSVVFYKGLFRNTIPTFAKSGLQVAILRIDGNFYDSYQDALYYMYPLVPVGGIIIFDDIMSHPPVMKCWLDFKKEHMLEEDLLPIDDNAAWFVTTKNMTIDFQYFRAPQNANVQPK